MVFLDLISINYTMNLWMIVQHPEDYLPFAVKFRGDHKNSSKTCGVFGLGTFSDGSCLGLFKSFEDDSKIYKNYGERVGNEILRVVTWKNLVIFLILSRKSSSTFVQMNWKKKIFSRIPCFAPMALHIRYTRACVCPRGKSCQKINFTFTIRPRTVAILIVNLTFDSLSTESRSASPNLQTTLQVTIIC